jgi:hypothetical protein
VQHSLLVVARMRGAPLAVAPGCAMPHVPVTDPRANSDHGVFVSTESAAARRSSPTRLRPDGDGARPPV